MTTLLDLGRRHTGVYFLTLKFPECLKLLALLNVKGGR